MYKTAMLLVALAMLATSISARAEVTSAAAGGFVTRHEVAIDAPRDEVWALLLDVSRWWNADHSISGDAANLSIRAEPLGCFCESLGDNGGVVHMTVTFVNAGVLLRLTGGLGPLGLMGVDGNMTWELADGEVADSTRAKFTYAVGGYYPDGLDVLAPAVDAVIGEALDRLKARAETGDADGITSD